MCLQRDVKLSQNIEECMKIQTVITTAYSVLRANEKHFEKDIIMLSYQQESGLNKHYTIHV